MKFAFVFWTIFAAMTTTALAADLPNNPDITLKASELQALINAAVANHDAEAALKKVNEQLKIKTVPNTPPAHDAIGVNPEHPVVDAPANPQTKP